MSRLINPNLRWGKVLKYIREGAGLTQSALADRLGYAGEGKGSISFIESGKVSIDEEKIRLWVKECNKTMFEFYMLATELESGTFLLHRFSSTKKS